MCPRAYRSADATVRAARKWWEVVDAARRCARRVGYTGELSDLVVLLLDSFDGKVRP